MILAMPAGRSAGVLWMKLREASFCLPCETMVQLQTTIYSAVLCCAVRALRCVAAPEQKAAVHHAV